MISRFTKAVGAWFDSPRPHLYCSYAFIGLAVFDLVTGAYNLFLLHVLLAAMTFILYKFRVLVDDLRAANEALHVQLEALRLTDAASKKASRKVSK